jgi:hypothetical protein
MRKEDIPPANEYERGVLRNRRRQERPEMERRVGQVALLQTYVARLLDLRLSFTHLKIGSLDHWIQLVLLRKPGRVDLYLIKPKLNHTRDLEEFFAKLGIESIADHLGCPPWTLGPSIGYCIKSDVKAISELVSELLASVYGAEVDAEFEFVLT